MAALKTVVWRNAFGSDIRRVLAIGIRSSSYKYTPLQPLQACVVLGGRSCWRQQGTFYLYMRTMSDTLSSHACVSALNCRFSKIYWQSTWRRRVSLTLSPKQLPGYDNMTCLFCSTSTSETYLFQNVLRYSTIYFLYQHSDEFSVPLQIAEHV